MRRPAGPRLVVRMVGLVVENLCMQSRPGAVEEGSNVSKTAHFFVAHPRRRIVHSVVKTITVVLCA